jgi:hypothetical protein
MIVLGWLIDAMTWHVVSAVVLIRRRWHRTK